MPSVVDDIHVIIRRVEKALGELLDRRDAVCWAIDALPEGYGGRSLCDLVTADYSSVDGFDWYNDQWGLYGAEGVRVYEWLRFNHPGDYADERFYHAYEELFLDATNAFCDAQEKQNAFTPKLKQEFEHKVACLRTGGEDFVTYLKNLATLVTQQLEGRQLSSGSPGGGVGIESPDDGHDNGQSSLESLSVPTERELIVLRSLAESRVLLVFSEIEEKTAAMGCRVARRTFGAWLNTYKSKGIVATPKGPQSGWCLTGTGRDFVKSFDPPPTA